MNVDIAEQLSVKVHCGTKNSSGTIYVNGKTVYVFTAKHSVCPKAPSECWLTKRECNSCELKNTYKAKITDISIANAGPENLSLKPKKVIAHKNKDLAILIFKDNNLPSIVKLPNTKISTIDDIEHDDKFITSGYPNVTDYKECQPIHYSNVSKFKSEIYLKIEVNTVSNIESAKDNISANSGAGIMKNHDSKNLLVGIYTKTGDLDAAYGEYIDHTVNDLLISSNLEPLVFDNNAQQISTLIKDDFLKCFTRIPHELNLGKQRELNLYTIKLNGNNIAYDDLKERLSECIKLFTLPRKLIQQYQKKNLDSKAAKQGDKLFLELKNNDKVAELLLQGFLESHLNAPKLYSYLPNSSQLLQSVHIKLISSQHCELIYSTAKMGTCLEKTLLASLNNLLQAIPNLSGAGSLVGTHLFDSTFDHKEQAILEKFLIPTEDHTPKNINNSFAIFIGFDFQWKDDIFYKNITKFNQLFQNEIIEKIQTVLVNISALLDKFNIVDSELNCYLVPFNDTQKFCQSFLEEL